MEITVTKPKKAASKKKVALKPAKAPKPKQQKLFDTEVPALEKLAEDYVEARDQRMEYLKTEVLIKDELHTEMKRLGKKDYVRGNIEIHVVQEDETVKVKIKHADEAE
jgi:hypothetical protein